MVGQNTDPRNAHAYRDTPVFSLTLTCAANAADLIAFWDTPQHGGNSFNRLPPDQAYFDALKKYGASWVWLSYDKWKPAKRDFLIGDADHYEGIPASDLATLKATLNRADRAGLIDANEPDPVKRKATQEFEPIRKRLHP